MNIDKTYRRVFLTKKIERDKQEITTDTALLGASALAIGIGTLGAKLLGKNTINQFKTDNSNITVTFKKTGYILSLATLVTGVVSAINNTKNALAYVKTLKRDENKLKEVKRESLRS